MRKAEASLGDAYKKAHDPMGKRMVARRLLDITLSGIADMGIDAFTKRRRL